MKNMFYNCTCLTYLNLANFNTNDVTDMSYMFYGCTRLNKDNIITKDKRINIITANLGINILKK